MANRVEKDRKEFDGKQPPHSRPKAEQNKKICIITSISAMKFESVAYPGSYQDCSLEQAAQRCDGGCYTGDSEECSPIPLELYESLSPRICAPCFDRSASSIMNEEQSSESHGLQET